LAILVTGASSGIGAALVVRYAAPGVHLSLWGRDAARLALVAEQARGAGATVGIVAVELADIADAVRAAKAADDTTPFDLVILAAGRGGVRAADRLVEDPGEVARIMAVNLAAPAAMATALAGRMAARGGGRIALIGSTAGFFPLPQAPAYAASKAGLGVFASALRLAVAGHGVSVTLVSPGFVDTPMSQGVRTPKPFLMSADKAAALIVAGVRRRARHVILPWPFAVLPVLAWMIPGFVRDRVLVRLDARPM